MTSQATCILCGAPCAPRLRVHGHQIHRCSRCDLEFVHPTPSPEEIAAVYAGGYFTGGAYADYFENERKTSMHKARQRLDTFAELGLGGGRLLDLGCAAGYFVDEALGRGFDAWGVEPSEDARRQAPARALDRVVATLDDARLPRRFDAVTLWDVLEHLPDPEDAIAGIRERLAPGGWLGIVVPAIGNINTRWAPSTWDQYKPPEHLWYWSLRSLSAFLDRQGFEVVRHGVAWERASRWFDLQGTRRHLGARTLRKLDAAIHKGLAALAGRELITDSIALYARSRA